MSSNTKEGVCVQSVIEDMRTSIPDQVAFRIDFREWLSRLHRRDRSVTESLAAGYSTSEVASGRDFARSRVTAAAELHRGWHHFHGEGLADLAAAIVG